MQAKAVRRSLGEGGQSLSITRATAGKPPAFHAQNRQLIRLSLFCPMNRICAGEPSVDTERLVSSRQDCAREDAISCMDSQLITPPFPPSRHVTVLTDWRLRSKNKPRSDDVGCSRPQPTTPLAANQRADRAAQPGAIIPPVLELPQATWLQSVEKKPFGGACVGPQDQTHRSQRRE